MKEMQVRGSGILLPIFSLPSPYGIGTMGSEAKRFVDFLEKAGQTYWQILPVGQTSYGDSPYQSFSTFAGNPYFIDFDLLYEQNLLKKTDYNKIDWGKNLQKIDYNKLSANRFNVLRKAFNNFIPDEKYQCFCNKNSFWLDDFALYMAIKDTYNGKPWNEWDKEIVLRKKETISELKQKLKK